MTQIKSSVLDRFYAGTSDEKIAAMEELYRVHGVALEDNEKIQQSMTLLATYTAALSSHMVNMHLDALCTSCAATTGGGCCSSYMEANSNVLMLLINKLAGIEVVRQHPNSTECCFLGRTGCILSIKPVFCLNYNCKHITDKATGNEMTELERLAGQLLCEQTRLEDVLLNSF